MERTVVLSIASYCGLLLLFATGCGNTDNMLTPTDNLTTNSVAADSTHQLTPSTPGVTSASKNADLQKHDSGNSPEAMEGTRQLIASAPFANEIKKLKDNTLLKTSTDNSVEGGRKGFVPSDVPIAPAVVE